jgi:hypothetical protein
MRKNLQKTEKINKIEVNIFIDYLIYLMHSNFKNKNFKALGIIFTYGAMMLLDKSLRKHTLR